MITKITYKSILLPALLGLTLSSCGDDGDQRAGLSSLVSITAEPEGENCANGGTKITAGADLDSSGTLEASEVTTTEYVCNGASGTDGADGQDGSNGSLINIINLPPSQSCSGGVLEIQHGIDDNGNGILEAEEIDGTAYACAAHTCLTDADCGGAVDSCDTQTNLCLTTLTRWSNGTTWPDQACNPTNSFGGCDTNAQNHADAWAAYVCIDNGWTGGVWTGNKQPGCSGGLLDGDPSTSMFCLGSIPCAPDVETICANSDQTQVEFTCTR